MFPRHNIHASLSLACAFWHSVAVAAPSASASNNSPPAVLNFRPENVTLSDLYDWVGSYYNGTTHLEFFSYAGLASSETSDCPDFPNKTITKDYTTVLGLMESSMYNTYGDPVNAFFTIWPHCTLESGFDNFVWSLEKTQAPPYNLSSVLTDYQGFNDFHINSTTTCLGIEIFQWRFAPISFNGSFNGTAFTNPVIDLQFDGQTANLFMQGYFEASPQYTDRVEDIVMFAGKFIMTFLGVIDGYHSDILTNDTDTPTWVRTVGYQNNSLNVGYAMVSAGNQLTGSYLLAMMLALLYVLVFHS